MTYPVLTAAILIEANGAALNNAGSDSGAGRLDNTVVVKQIKIGRHAYPYISGQAVRRWWRETLYADFGWAPSPVTREAKSAFTLGDPITYADDDVFGYMAAKKAPKKGRGKEKEKPASETVEMPLDNEPTAKNEDEASGGTQRRISPLKNSLLVSVLPNVITTDFGHFSRDLPVDNPNMVPFEHQHYSAIMQGVFTISLVDVGRFECGPMRDIPMEVHSDKTIEVQPTDKLSKPRILAMPVPIRRQRVADAIRALGRLRYGANLTRNLSDVAPVIILGGFLDGGNAPFQSLFTYNNNYDNNGQTQLNIARLRSVIKDYKDRFLASQILYFGYRPGILANEAEVLAAFGIKDENLTEGQSLSPVLFEGIEVRVGTPGEIVELLAQAVLHDNIVVDLKG